MDKNNKIAIAIGTVVVLALVSGVYFLDNFKNQEDISDNKNKPTVQSNSNKNESNKNEEGNSNNSTNKDELALTDKNKQNNSTNSNSNIKNENVSVNNNEWSQSQEGTEKSEVSGEEVKPEAPESPSEGVKPETPENPGGVKPETPESPGESEKPEQPEVPVEPEKPVTDIIITKDDLVNGVVTISNKEYESITIESSVANAKVVLDNVEIKEKLILEDKVQYQVDIKNSTVPYIKIGKDELIRNRNVLLDINKNISGPTLNLENVKEISNIEINGNASINGDGKISNLNLLNGTVFVDVPTEVMNISENSIYADVTINKSINEINNSGSSTSIGVNANIDRVSSNGNRGNIYIKKGVTVGKAIINGDSTKIMGNGKLNAVDINGNNIGVYTETPKENVAINEDSNNVFVGRENKYEISAVTLKQQGVIEFTLNEKTSRPLTTSDISIICQGGNSMSVFSVTTTDNQKYILNTSYYKDNTYELYITLPNGNIISKEFDYSYNHPTASKVTIDRTSQTEAVLDVYGVDEGGYLYYKLVEKTKFRVNKNISAEDIKKTGTKVFMKTEYNEIAISELEENKEYELYYVMEGYDGRTSPVYGPLELGEYKEKPEADTYKLDYVSEVEANKFVFTFNKPVKGELKLEDFKIVCPTESALTTKGAKFIVSSDKQTYTIIVPDNYGHKDNKYTVSVNMPDGTVVTGSFRSHFNPPAITGASIEYSIKDKLKFEFNSDEHGELYYGIYEWNNSVFAGDSTTPMADDVLSGKVKGTKAKLNAGYNKLDIDLSGYTLTNKSRLWVLYVDYDGNYRKGFVDHYKIPEFTGNPDGGEEEDKSSLDITNIEVGEGGMGTRLNLTFNEDLTTTFGQRDIKLESLSGVTLPGRIAMSVSFPSDKANFASIEFMGLFLKPGDYRITINTYDSKDKPVTIVKEFTVK